MGAGDGEAALEAAGQIAPAGDREAEASVGRVEADGAVGDVEDDVGQAEGLAARRRQQFVDLAPGNAAILEQAAPEPDPAGGTRRPG